MTWQEKFEQIMRLVLEFLEITHPTRPGQPSLGATKNAAAVSVAQTLLMTGAIGGTIPIEAFEARYAVEGIDNLVLRMQSEGRLGGLKSGADVIGPADRSWLERFRPLIELGASIGTGMLMRSKPMSSSSGSVADMVKRVLQ